MQQKFALVTGGNRGIGLEICKKLVERGKPVMLTARSSEAAAAAAQQLRQLRPAVDVQPFALEAGDAGSIEQLTSALQRYDQQIDLVINNAAILVRKVWDEPTYRETLAVDVAAPLLITEQLLPLLPAGSLVIMVSSGNGMSPCLTPDYLAAVRGVSDPRQLLHDAAARVPFDAGSPMGRQPDDKPGSMAPTYSVAKALLNRAVQLLAAPGSALQRAGVSVVAVSPGWCRTDMGTDKAERSAAAGADSVLWPWLNLGQPSFKNGSFTRDGIELEW